MILSGFTEPMDGGELLGRAGQAVGLIDVFAGGGTAGRDRAYRHRPVMEAAGGTMQGKSSSEMAGGTIVNLIGGKIGVAAGLLKASEAMNRGVNGGYWLPEASVGQSCEEARNGSTRSISE
jgi:hypothetical protein